MIHKYILNNYQNLYTFIIKDKNKINVINSYSIKKFQYIKIFNFKNVYTIFIHNILSNIHINYYSFILEIIIREEIGTGIPNPNHVPIYEFIIFFFPFVVAYSENFPNQIRIRRAWRDG